MRCFQRLYFLDRTLHSDGEGIDRTFEALQKVHLHHAD